MVSASECGQQAEERDGEQREHPSIHRFRALLDGVSDRLAPLIVRFRRRGGRLRHLRAPRSSMSITTASRFVPDRIAVALRCSARARRRSRVRTSLTWPGGAPGFPRWAIERLAAYSGSTGLGSIRFAGVVAGRSGWARLGGPDRRGRFGLTRAPGQLAREGTAEWSSREPWPSPAPQLGVEWARGIAGVTQGQRGQGNQGEQGRAEQRREHPEKARPPLLDGDEGDQAERCENVDGYTHEGQSGRHLLGH